MLSSRNVTTRWLPCTPVFNIDTDNEHRPTQTDSPSSIIDPISNDPPGQSVLKVPSCTISLSLSRFDRDILIAKNTKGEEVSLGNQV